ncbi:MAG: hypothetical protein AB7F28_08640 [Candidatus Margulisiibacteriota bacterium]
MKKRLLTLFCFAWIGLTVIPTPTFGVDQQALKDITRMLGSLNHIRTLKCDVTSVQKNSQKTTTLNYTLMADNNNQKVVVFTSPIKVTYVKNKKGLYMVRNGNAEKQSPKAPFPVDVPNQFLNQLKLKDVTDNYTFVTNSRSADAIIIDMIPVGTGGQSIQDALKKEAVTMLRFTIGLPYYTLNKVEIFKNNRLTTEEWVEVDYEIIRNKVLEKTGFFRNTYSESDALMLTHTLSVSRTEKNKDGTPKQQVKEVFYSKITLNEKLDPKLFDEEAY